MTLINPSTDEFWDLTFFLVDKTPHKRDKDYDPKVIQEYVRNIVCNMVDMVEGNDEDLDVVTLKLQKNRTKKELKKEKYRFLLKCI